MCKVKAQKNDNFGISSLKFNGLMYSDSSSKSEILNKQFQSVFTKKSTTATPRLFGNKYPSIGILPITLKGVQKLLEKINISKADLIPGRMLNMLAHELASILHAIFTRVGRWHLPVNTGVDNTPKSGVYRHLLAFINISLISLQITLLTVLATYNVIHGHHSTIFAAYA